MQKQDNNFDLIRLFAAVQVMLMHTLSRFDLGIPNAWIDRTLNLFPGVAIFFVISGFLISGSYLAKPSLGPYFRNRVLRIYPALWLNLTCIVAALLWFGMLRADADGLHVLRWISTLAAVGSNTVADRIADPIFVSSSIYGSFPSGVLWTITVELSFYLLLPIILARFIVSRGFAGASLLLWTGVSLIVFAHSDETGDPLSIHRYLWLFLAGAAMQLYWPKIGWMLEGKAWIWLPVYTITALIVQIQTDAGYNYGVFSLHSFPLAVLLLPTVISCAFTSRGASKILRNNDLSYGIYLWHMPVALALIVMGFDGDPRGAAASVTITILLAAFSWRVVERRLLKLKQKPRGKVDTRSADKAPAPADLEPEAA